MNGGRIVQVGSPAEIYNHPSSEFASRFIGETNLLDGKVKAAAPDHMEIDVNGLLLFTPLTAGLSPGQKAVVSIRPERANLFLHKEDIPESLRNVFLGTVESAIFLGSIARYHIRLPNDQIFVAEEATVDGALGYSINTRLYVGWEAKNNIVLVA
jgi:ABC-type Fe3+/spermidine/putrescine transport system ATPase subunit